jgi:NTE family protein
MATDFHEGVVRDVPLGTAGDRGKQPVDLALSGGGIRAMVFHAGVLRYLAERALLERVRHVSSVSGGSLLVGLILQFGGMRWPSSSEYLERILPAIRVQLTTRNLQAAAIARLLLPWNWQFLMSRANVIAKAITSLWEIRATLADLPDTPLWSINGTTAETGRRFRFKANGCGDYQLGYADASAFPLAQALAMSAAFPGAIGPLAIKCSQYNWRKRPYWGAPISEEKETRLPFTRLHLYDGGLYDNLGLEPLFDVGLQQPKGVGGTLIVSDAGAPLTEGFNSAALSPRRMKRWFDLVMEQQRALRVRSLVNALRNGVTGAYLQIGSVAAEQLRIHPHPPADHTLHWLTSGETRAAASCPTSLGQVSSNTFDDLSRHGYETAHWNDLSYPYSVDPVRTN